MKTPTQKNDNFTAGNKTGIGGGGPKWLGKFALGLFFAGCLLPSYAEEQHGLTTVINYRGYRGIQTAILSPAVGKQICKTVTPVLDCRWGEGKRYRNPATGKNHKIQDVWPEVELESFLAIRFVGSLHAPKAGTYILRFGADPSGMVMLDGRVIVDAIDGRNARYHDVPVEFGAGQSKEIVVEFYNWSNGIIRLLWKEPGASDFVVIPQSAFTPCPGKEEPVKVDLPGMEIKSGLPGDRAFATLSAPEGTYLRYTKDDTEPTRLHGALYTAPVAITEDCTLKVRAFLPSGGQSDVLEKAFTLDAPPPAEGLRVLTTGNSLTHNAWTYLPGLELAGGTKIFPTFVNSAGATAQYLWEHFVEANPSDPKKNAREQIASNQPFDCMITQPFCPTEKMDVANELEFISKFYDLVLEGSPRADLWIYAQWKVWELPTEVFPDSLPTSSEEGWLRGMEQYLSEVETLREELQTKYPQNKVRIIPVASAMLALRQAINDGRIPGMKNYESEIMSDGIHLGNKGCYFLSLVFYSCLNQKSPKGLVVADTGLDVAQQEKMQEIAWDTARNYQWSGVEKEK